MLDVTSMAPGRRQPLSAPFQVAPPAGLALGEPVSLQDLIEITVRHEVAAYEERRAERSLLHVLSERELDIGLACGAVHSEVRLAAHAPPEKEAIATALEAFGDGLFLVLVDGTQYTELGSPVPLHDRSTITYVRLVAPASKNVGPRLMQDRVPRRTRRRRSSFGTR